MNKPIIFISPWTLSGRWQSAWSRSAWPPRRDWTVSHGSASPPHTPSIIFSSKLLFVSLPFALSFKKCDPNVHAAGCCTFFVITFTRIHKSWQVRLSFVLVFKSLLGRMAIKSTLSNHSRAWYSHIVLVIIFLLSECHQLSPIMVLTAGDVTAIFIFRCCVQIKVCLWHCQVSLFACVSSSCISLHLFNSYLD